MIHTATCTVMMTKFEEGCKIYYQQQEQQQQEQQQQH